MAQALKYLSFIRNFSNCPPALSKEINESAFRFIFEDKNHPDNFKPVLLIKPSRINDKQFDAAQMKCSGYALSFYNSIINARSSFMILYKRNKNIANNVGSHVAEISVEPKEGVATPLSPKGHFDFFEYAATNFHNKIISIGKLIP